MDRADTDGDAAQPFSQPLPIPEVLAPTRITDTTDYYDLAVTDTVEELLPGVKTPVRTYGGGFVGPTIVATRGRRVILRQTNHSDTHISTHLHGGDVASVHDGRPMDVIMHGTTGEYIYPNEQPGATLWYHDHAHHSEAENVYRGLAGFYLLHDPAEDGLRLPSGEFDIPIMLRDAGFEADGSLHWVMDDLTGRDTVLVNGRHKPFLTVAGRKYRFRFLNAANLRQFRLRLSTGDKWTQVAGDQGLLPQHFHTDALELWPAERGEVVIDFSKYRPGTRITLENTLGGTDKDTPLLQFLVGAAVDDDSVIPAKLGEPPALGRSDNTRVVTLGPSDPDNHRMLIDGKTFDPERIDNVVTWGTTETWEIRNREVDPPIPHDFHMHLVRFRVLDRDGEPPTPDDSGWKDTVKVGPGQTVRIQTRFDTYLGPYVYHCHFFDHSAMGMMAQFEVVDAPHE